MFAKQTSTYTRSSEATTCEARVSGAKRRVYLAVAKRHKKVWSVEKEAKQTQVYELQYTGSSNVGIRER